MKIKELHPQHGRNYKPVSLKSAIKKAMVQILSHEGQEYHPVRIYQRQLHHSQPSAFHSELSGTRAEDV